MSDQSTAARSLSDAETTTFLHWLGTLQAAAQSRRHRCLVVLAGARDWSHGLIRAVLEDRPAPSTLWVGEAAAGLPAGVEVIAVDAAVRHIGRETDRLVYDAWAGLDADAFAAISGTLRAGTDAGLCFLLCPALDAWPDYADPRYARMTVAPYTAADVGRRFVRRFVTRLRADPRVARVEQGRPLPDPGVPAGEAPGEAAPMQAGAPAPYRSADQQQAVAAVKKVITGQRRRPTVLVADRGRGKSAALGMAAAQLLQAGLRDIVVTGPGVAAVEAVFAHAAALLPGAERRRGELRHGEGRLRFVAPDLYLREGMRSDLLLVDEAAAIPTHILVDLLRAAPRVAFATTVHGYEGTGRGFALRFRAALDAHTRGWRELRLETPIRWAAGDPLEAFLFAAFLLDAEFTADVARDDAAAGRCRVEELDRDALCDDEATLAALFGLLINAHYRTRPDDLRYLLDGPNIRVLVARHDDVVVGTALVAQEGGFDAQDALRIGRGDIRPHGHLLPETLAVHLGLEKAAMLTSHRILRIAVHPRLRRCGIASALLERLRRRAVDGGVDFLGASFGATPELVRFWNACGFTNVRASLRRGGTTALHSALVLAPVSGEGVKLIREARGRFLDLFPRQLCDSLARLDAPLVHALMQGSAPPLVLSATDHEMLKAWIGGHRLFEVSLAAIWRFACHALTRPEMRPLAEAEEWEVLVERVLQCHDWQTVSTRHGLAGRRAVDARLRKLLGVIYAEYWRRGLFAEQ